jgi:hypothetical protein
MKDYSRPKKIYVQTLLFCNMECQHCCYNCGPKHHEFMSMETFEASLKWEPQTLFNFGGGEPTCHPLFWEFMNLAIKTRGVNRVWIATNGKCTNDALLLAGMVKSKVIKGCLSQDQWHQPIRQDVVDAFIQARSSSMKPTIRNAGINTDPIRQGRCDWGNRFECNACGGPFVQYDGQVRQCGCLDAPIIGSVFDGYKPIHQGSKTWACAFGRPDPNVPISRHISRALSQPVLV